MKLSIIIPAYNEGKTITQVLKKILALDTFSWKKEIIVVDDCSNDSTQSILTKFANRIKAIRHSKNLGKGAAIRTGLKSATGDYLIIQDADLEYNPQDIRGLLVVAQNNPNFAVFGSRFRGRHEDTIFGHKFGNLFLTLLTNLLYGAVLSDMETCYKLIPLKYLKRIKLSGNRFDFEPEIAAKLLKLNVGILEVPINYQKRDFSQGKKIKWFQDGLSAIWTLLKNRIND